MSGECWNYFTDAHYARNVWSVVNVTTGERGVNPFEGDISLLVSEENQLWCKSNPNKWLHQKFGDGRVHAVKRVTNGGFVKVWIGSSNGSGHLRYQARFCSVCSLSFTMLLKLGSPPWPRYRGIQTRHHRTFHCVVSNCGI